MFICCLINKYTKTVLSKNCIAINVIIMIEIDTIHSSSYILHICLLLEGKINSNN